MPSIQSMLRTFAMVAVSVAVINRVPQIKRLVG